MISYQSDKLKRHFQSGIKLSFSGCYEEGTFTALLLRPVAVWPSLRRRAGAGEPVGLTPNAPQTKEARLDARCFPKGQRETKSQARPKRKDTEDGGLLTTATYAALGWGSELATQGTCGRPGPQSPSASESANFSSHLTSNGRSLPGSSSIFCESSRSVGSRLAMVSCSVS